MEGSPFFGPEIGKRGKSMYPKYQEDEVDRFFREQEEAEKAKNEPEGLPSPGGFVPAAFNPSDNSDNFDDSDAYSYREGLNASEVTHDRYEQIKKETEHMEQVQRCTEMSKKFMWLFLILAGSVLINAIVSIMSYMRSKGSGGNAMLLIMVGLSIISVVVTIPYGIILISMRYHVSDFKLAGMYVIFCQCFSGLASSISTGAYILFSLLSAVFSVLYMIKFATAMSSSFDNIANYMAITWETFKKIYIYLQIGLLICTAACIIPILNIFALIGILLLELAAIGVSIWQIVLLFRSSRVMDQYAHVIHA